MGKNRKGVSIAKRISAAAFVMIFVSVAVLGTISYFLYRNETISSAGDGATKIAEAVALTIDPAEYRKAMESGEETPYWHKVKNYFDTTKQRLNLAYLYLIDARYSGEVTYFVEGALPGEQVFGLAERESVASFSDEIFDTIKTGKPSKTDIYDLGGYGALVTGNAPVLDESGAVIAVIGVDVGVDSVVSAANTFGLEVIALVIFFSVLFGIIFFLYINKTIGRPISAISAASDKMAMGDMDISLSYKANDEIGTLTNSFLKMLESTKKQVLALEMIADGNLEQDINVRCENDSMGCAIKRTVDNLNEMFEDIKQSTARVALGSKQLSDGAQSLAQGSTEQASAVEELSSSISDVAGKTRGNADMAERAAALARTIKSNAQKGSEHMDRMTSAVGDINDASKSISKVIKVIDDIAFQTNILALNAAVEAARAGQHGKGFAVVAEEVRNLAAKSAQAAKNTGSLIEDSMNKATLGAQIAGETAGALSEIVEGINDSSAIVSEIARSTEEQSAAIEQINYGIEQVAQVVQQNSATAQESAAASVDISGESDQLNSLVARFRLKSDSGDKRLMLPDSSR